MKVFYVPPAELSPWLEILRQVPKFKRAMLDTAFQVSYDQSGIHSAPDMLMDRFVRDLRQKIRDEHPEMLGKDVEISIDDHFSENGQLIRTFTVTEKREPGQS